MSDIAQVDEPKCTRCQRQTHDEKTFNALHVHAGKTTHFVSGLCQGCFDLCVQLNGDASRLAEFFRNLEVTSVKIAPELRPVVDG